MEDNSEPPPQDLKMSRRTFLGAVGALFGKKALESVPHLEQKNNSPQQEESETPRKTIEELVAEVESMSVEEMEHALYEEYPVVPNIESIADRINEITDIPEGSVLMKAGTSVSQGMLESVFSPNIDRSDINFGKEQYKVEKVLSHVHVPPESFEAATLVGNDIAGFFDPMFCIAEICRPNEGVLDTMIREYSPKVAINFIGTNSVRAKIPLENFADQTQMLIDYYSSKGVIPILTTFPHPKESSVDPYKTWFEKPYPIVHPGQDESEVVRKEIEFRKSMLPENSLKYNLILLKLSESNQIPIINLQRGVVESAQNNGTITTEANWHEIDPEHFSHLPSPTALQIPEGNNKFEKGEQAVSYFTVETLYEILKHQNG